MYISFVSFLSVRIISNRFRLVSKKKKTLHFSTDFFLFAVSLILFKIKTLSVWVSVWIRSSLLDCLVRDLLVFLLLFFYVNLPAELSRPLTSRSNLVAP